MAMIQACLLAGACLGQAAGGTAEAAAPEAAAQGALEEFVAEAKTYGIEQRGAKEERLEFVPQPLLHWANPARNGEDGAVFVWLKAGRPEVIGSVFEYAMRGRIVRKHALHSLSELPVVANYENVEIWSPKAEGVKFAPVPDAESPADNSRRRLSQMRSLARQFSVEMVDLRSNDKSELRLMTQPLYRYEPTSGPARDGAIFAFAVGTDPEALLLLESRKEGEAARWEFAFARFHFVSLTARHNGQQVWQVESDPDMMRTVFGGNDPQRGKTYYSVIKSARPQAQ